MNKLSGIKCRIRNCNYDLAHAEEWAVMALTENSRRHWSKVAERYKKKLMKLNKELETYNKNEKTTAYADCP